MATVEIDKIEYLEVQILKTEINNLIQNPLKKGDAFQAKYEFKVSDFYNVEKDLIRVILDVRIRVSKENVQLEAGAQFEIDNYFKYQDLKSFARVDDGKVMIDAQFSNAVKGTAYSTARGIIFSKLSGTFLDGIVLPIKMSTDF